MFSENNSVQNLVGICPEALCVVTEYVGRTLDHYLLQGCLSMQHKYSVLRQICTILRTLHHHGFAYNDLKPQNICVKVSASGPKVTLTDLGLTLLAGIHSRLDIRWTETLLFAPEICGRENPGPCGKESDTYSLGKFLCCVYGEERMPQVIERWYVRDQKLHPNERASAKELEELLECESRTDNRSY